MAWATETSYGRFDCLNITHREPEELSPISLEALLENLDEHSATRRHFSPWLVDSNGLLLAQTFDLAHKVAAGKKGVPKSKLMVTKIAKHISGGNFEEKKAEAAESMAALKRRRAERLHRKRLQEEESRRNPMPEIES